MAISGVETITHTAGTVTAATLNGLTATLTGNATTDNFIVQGADAVNDVIDVSGITHNGAAAVDFAINGGTGDDTITGSASHDAIDADAGADTVYISDGTDTILLGGTTDADSVYHTNVEDNAATSTVTEFITTQDTLYLSAADLNTVVGSAAFSAGDSVTIDELDTTGAADTATGTAFQFIYDEATGMLSIDVDGDTGIDGANAFTGDTDDIDLITISNDGTYTGDIVAADITIIA
jgi:hypothetical protein